MTKVGSAPGAGVLVTASAPGNVHRNLIFGLAARYRLPVLYPYRYFIAAEGLLGYGPDTIDQYRRTPAGYVEGILKGEKP
jgi:putative ABC transport system substrate-binding protein